jgi:hypothetical protein
MEKLSVIIMAFSLVTGLFHSGLQAIAQVPEKMSYQAVIRDKDDKLVTNSDIGMQISILQGSPDGTPVYIERHFPTTNVNGLVSIEIGEGIVVAGSFVTIDWINGTYFIKTEVDLNGGANFTIEGTSQILSVPYALHSKTAEKLKGKEPFHVIGELYGGGIVFWTTPDGQHGLIASLYDLYGGNLVTWSNITNTAIGAAAQDYYDGSKNTAAIISQSGHTGSAAKLCDDYTYEEFDDWYLPSVFELRKLMDEAILINYILSNDGNSTTKPLNFSSNKRYWSSTEYSSDAAYSNSFVALQGKFGEIRVRAVRAF